MSIETGWAEVNGTRLYYEVAGQGMPVALIHGFGLDRRMWQPQFAPLSEHCRMLRYDRRGFGRSAPPDHRAYDSAADLEALLRYLGLSPAVLVGHMYGAWVALNCAIRCHSAVRGLVLADAVLPGRAWSEEYHAALSGTWAECRLVDVSITKQRWLSSRLFQPGVSSPAVAARLAHMVGEYSGWHFLNDDADELGDAALGPLGGIGPPALVIVGAQALPDFHAIAAELQQIVGARAECLAGAGHHSSLEAPERFNALVLEFIAQL